MKSIRKSKRRSGMSLVEMGIALFVISFMITVLTSMIRNIPYLKSTENEAIGLKNNLAFARQAALKSNQDVFFEFDLDQNGYRAYRKIRTEEKIIEKTFLKKENLSQVNSLIAVSVGNGARIVEGKIVLTFSPEGDAPELAVYMGRKPDIKVTVLHARYGSLIQVLDGEKEAEAPKIAWEDNLEER